jgi:hypothetical protein
VTVVASTSDETGMVDQDKETWVVTWLSGEFRARIHHATVAPMRERKVFDNQKEAVSFVMGLDEMARRSAELEMPGGQTVVGFLDIKRMHEDQRLAEDKARNI